MNTAGRFWQKVNAVGDCWEWTGSRDSNGRGQFWMHGKLVTAPRAAWLLAGRSIDGGMSVCHHCDNPGCIRLAHLFLGTQADNLMDMREKHRQVNPPDPRGEQNPQARLTAESVRDIRRLRSEGTSLETLAKKYGVRITTISAAARGQNWKHVQ